ncbi:thiol reductant ABC exporter subunit CydD [Lolliginicoccus suaedae]|uniref:thiol reductant ABC exporter subunit CydD n=1 Tax=Lolliginicoccus suaedae TaxID=2605429 RepID=UPI0011EC380D|nr:thiol reductant ABC exporter subunit CydD [Lolliginicoccus suaedae]
MKPFDPRLWRLSRPVRPYLVLTVITGAITTATILATAILLARILAGAAHDPGLRALDPWTTELIALAVIAAIRAAAAWAQARHAQRSAAAVVSGLKSDVLDAVAELPPRRRAETRDEAALLVTRGLDGLIPYLSGYLPTLVLAVLVPPAVLVTIALHDLTAAIIIAVTLPLVPLFMILIGLLTRNRARNKLRAMTALQAQLLDLIAGLPTLRAHRREAGQAELVQELGENHRTATMGSLRIAFLSSMVLEALATLCVALVAVSVGLRLVFGNMELDDALVALILAAEAYLPLRMVGSQFHAAEDGAEAAQRALAILDREHHAGREAHEVVAAPFTITARGLSMRARDGHAPANLDAVFQPGAVTVLAGPNGSGKSTALHAVLGLASPDEGTVAINGIAVSRLGLDQWWSNVAWVPQRPVLVPGTVRDNLELAGPLPPEALARGIEEAGFADVLAELPNGIDTLLGSGGTGLSVGQRQRLALARALARQATVLLLDEPTAHLDARAARRVLDAVRRRAHQGGATVVLIAHDPSVLAAADRVIEVRASTGDCPAGATPQSTPTDARRIHGTSASVTSPTTIDTRPSDRK